ncbi:hypothetical protein N7540_009116 [Penicillium herquei]|nr:hypothetical protein N7540_009116 [Penicillium herquei]
MGANLTYLVRPHHVQHLSRPQILYSYHNTTSVEFKNYTFITDPAQIAHSDYDYVLVTPDAATLMAALGVALVKTIGEAFKGRDPKIILAGTFHKLKSWFVETSGLPEDRLACIVVPIAIHETKAKLKTHGYVDMEQFDKADYAYARLNPVITLQIEDEPAFADFVKLDLWHLGTAAVKELRGLSLYGEAGRQAADATNEESLINGFSGMEQTALPLDQADFNRYHHGGKASKQDQDHVRACIEYAEADGKPLTAAPELLRRLEEKLASLA